MFSNSYPPTVTWSLLNRDIAPPAAYTEKAVVSACATAFAVNVKLSDV